MNIKKIRMSKNMTQKDLAKAIGVDHTIISKYEKGSVIPPTNRLEKIASVLGVSTNDLLDNNNQETTNILVEYAEDKSALDNDMLISTNSDLAKRLISYCSGYCELCKMKAPFTLEDGTPFLELHYIDWLSEGGSPTLDNLVALCPNCHRKIHSLHNREEDLHILREAAKKHDIDLIMKIKPDFTQNKSSDN